MLSRTMTNVFSTVSFAVTTVGLVITIIGFAITLYNVNKAKKLSEQIRGDLRRIDTVSEFSSAISCLSEIKVLHRMEAWEILPDKYSSLRKTLITIRASNPDMNDDFKRTIQGTISTLSNIENEIEILNFKKSSPADVPRLNQEISKQMDRLHPILIELQNRIGR